jgi:hypothetical protein
MDQNPKQQAVERIKGSTNILVTVSKNPTVDQLAACIGFTLLLNKFGKHATAVFSGAVPSTLEFLQPEKTIEHNTDSLRDFIVALDKSKADKLRYKVEDEVVRIFITPYRTSITEKDLEFSQGDFNVDVVVALGVTNKEDIDEAIVAHGRILHDAVVISVTNGQAQSDVGSVNWHDDTASSLSEMLVSISESFQSGLLDGQMATAFLTGIVAETERFSNDKTSPKVMTMSAQLMAAGANQQLIATQLAPPPPEPTPAPVAADVVDMPVEPYQPPLGDDKPEKPEETSSEPEEEKPAPKNDGEIEIEHEDEIHIDEQGNLKKQEELRAAEEAAKKKAEEERLEKERQSQEGEERKRLADSPAEQAVPGEPGEAPSLNMTGGESFLAGSSHKVLQPLSHPDEVNPLAAFAPPSVPEPAPDLTASMPLPPVAPMVSAVPPLPPEPTLASAPAPEPHHIIQPEPSWSLPAKESSLPPSDTLASLEQAVHSPHVEQASTPAESIDAARQAVQTASLDSEPRPQASQAVGAQIIDMAPPQSVPAPQMPGVGDVLQQSAAPAIDPMSPPPVPPPMMPQYINPQPPQTPQL